MAFREFDEYDTASDNNNNQGLQANIVITNDEKTKDQSSDSDESDPRLPTLIIGDGKCHGILNRGERKGMECGKTTAEQYVYCASHKRVNHITKDRLPVVLFEDQYLISEKWIIIDKDYVVQGIAKWSEEPVNNRSVLQGRLPLSEISQEDHDWCSEMGLIYPIMVKSAAKK